MVVSRTVSPARPPSPLSWLVRAGLFVTVLTLAACGPRYPLGMSEAEWKRLTPEQQMQARMKQADLSRAQAERSAQLAAERRQRREAMEAAERRRIAALYASGRFGDVVECVVDGGHAAFHRQWHGFTPVPFVLARGESRYIKVTGAGRRSGRFWVHYADDGRRVTICSREMRGRHARGCASFGGPNADFARGLSHRMSVANVFRDTRVVCAFRARRGERDIIIHRYDSEPRRIIYRHHYHREPPPPRHAGRGPYRRPAAKVPPRYQPAPPPTGRARHGDRDIEVQPLPPEPRRAHRDERNRTVAAPTDAVRDTRAPDRRPQRRREDEERRAPGPSSNLTPETRDERDAVRGRGRGPAKSASPTARRSAKPDKAHSGDDDGRGRGRAVGRGAEKGNKGRGRPR